MPIGADSCWQYLSIREILDFTQNEKRSFSNDTAALCDLARKKVRQGEGRKREGGSKGGRGGRDREREEYRGERER